MPLFSLIEMLTDDAMPLDGRAATFRYMPLMPEMPFL